MSTIKGATPTKIIVSVTRFQYRKEDFFSAAESIHQEGDKAPHFRPQLSKEAHFGTKPLDHENTELSSAADNGSQFTVSMFLAPCMWAPWLDAPDCYCTHP